MGFDAFTIATIAFIISFIIIVLSVCAFYTIRLAYNKQPYVSRSYYQAARLTAVLGPESEAIFMFNRRKDWKIVRKTNFKLLTLLPEMLIRVIFKRMQVTARNTFANCNKASFALWKRNTTFYHHPRAIIYMDYEISVLIPSYRSINGPPQNEIVFANINWKRLEQIIYWHHIDVIKVEHNNYKQREYMYKRLREMEWDGQRDDELQQQLANRLILSMA